MRILLGFIGFVVYLQSYPKYPAQATACDTWKLVFNTYAKVHCASLDPCASIITKHVALSDVCDKSQDQTIFAEVASRNPKPSKPVEQTSSSRPIKRWHLEPNLSQILPNVKKELQCILETT